MDEETKEKNASTDDRGETERQAFKTNSNKKKSLKWIIGAITMVMAAVIIGFVTYTQSPSYRSKQQLDLGEKYLEDMDYEQAIASFQLALEIDPDNADVTTAIMVHMDDFYQQARAYGSQGEFAAEKNIAVFMLSINENSYQAMIAEAEAAYGTGDIKTAKDTYERAKKAGAKAEDADHGIELCDAVLKLLKLCEAGNFSGVIDFINTADFEPIKNLLTEGNQISYSSEITIIIGLNEGSYYVLCGDIEDGILSDNGAAMVSSINTNSIYEGSFSQNKPEGSGKLSIWNKNEGISAASVYEGVFERGILNGKANYVTTYESEKVKVIITVLQGKIKIPRMDENGNLLLSNNAVVNGCFCIVPYEEEENGLIYNYVTGVPGFGGSDKKISVELLDEIPPVISCSLELEDDYWGGYKYYGGDDPIGKGITAEDNLDGDITRRITYEISNKIERYSWDYDIVVAYAVSDMAGNKAELTVIYNITDFCGDMQFRIVSVE